MPKSLIQALNYWASGVAQKALMIIFTKIILVKLEFLKDPKKDVLYQAEIILS